MKRRFLALVLAGCLAAVLSTAAWAMSPTAVSTADELTAALGNAAVTSIQLTGNIDISSTLVVTKDVTLDLNGFVLKITGSGSVIKIESGTLTLVDSNTSAEHKFTDDNGLWKLDDNGDKVVKGGVITGGTGSTYTYGNSFTVTYRDCGGGVFVAPGASFVMEGGNIVGCSAGKSGGGVFVAPGASFVMEGGNIVGCSAGKSGGGGVKVTNDGDFKMSGGTISGCIARNGGGLRNEGTATLSDTAKIESCRATGTESDDHGGGVCSYRNLTVSGSMVISGCTAQNNNSYAMYVTTGYPDARSSIEGGTFDGSVWLDHSSSGKITVSGGTFKNGVRGAWTVTFDTDGGSTAPDKQVRANSKVNKPDDPTKEGYTFEGWYDGDKKFDFDTPVSGERTVTLKAKWTKEAAKYYYYSPADGSADTTATAKGSPKTFDAGVGVYVGMVVMSVSGSAVVLGKKRK